MTRRRRDDPAIHGILNINKPSGWTSFDVVAFVRKQTGVRRVGHGGTLDPTATGVLPVGIGRATRFLEYLLRARKTYDATIALGVSTNTYDAEGDITDTYDASGIRREDVQSVLPRFVGEILQVPPMFSAIKLHGTPMYKLARAGEELDLQPRPVMIYDVQMTGFDPPFVGLRVECGKGTYIRSIAHDLGKTLGCGAHLAALVRTRVGPFQLRNAVSTETLTQVAQTGEWGEYLNAPDTTVEDWKAAIVGPEKVDALRMGQAVGLELDGSRLRSEVPTQCRAYGVDGEFIAIIHFDEVTMAWRPDKVVAANDGIGNR